MPSIIFRDSLRFAIVRLIENLFITRWWWRRKNFSIYSFDECMFTFIDFAVHLPNLTAVVVFVVDSKKQRAEQRENKKCRSKKDIVDPGLLLLHIRMKEKNCFYEKSTFVWVHFLFIDCGCCHSNAFYPFALYARYNNHKAYTLSPPLFEMYTTKPIVHTFLAMFFCCILLFLSLVMHVYGFFGNFDRIVVVVILSSLMEHNDQQTESYMCFVVVTILSQP